MARGGRPRIRTKRFTSRPPLLQRPKPPRKIKLIKPTPKRFGVGSTINIRTRKGGVQQIRLTKGKQSTQFNIPADRFDRSASDPRRIGKVAGLGKITKRKKRVKSIRTGRVTVASPSGKAGKTITVSTKSALASTKSVFPFEAVAKIRKRTQAKLRGRKRKPKPVGLRSRPRPTRQVKIPKRRFGTDFDIFRTFSKTTTTGRRSTGRPPRPTRQPKPPRRRFARRTRSGSDFDVLNF